MSIAGTPRRARIRHLHATLRRVAYLCAATTWVLLLDLTRAPFWFTSALCILSLTLVLTVLHAWEDWRLTSR